jgi:hypothetical protein
VHHVTRPVIEEGVVAARGDLTLFPPVSQTESDMSASSALADVAAGFRSLRGSPRELWLNYGVKALESFGYFSLSSILTVRCHLSTVTPALPRSLTRTCLLCLSCT